MTNLSGAFIGVMAVGLATLMTLGTAFALGSFLMWLFVL